VKPLLFINKVDRLIRELKLTPEQMQERFVKIIAKINQLIEKNLPPDFENDWKVRVEDGSVMFGSGFHRWALSVPHMKELNISFSDIINAYTEGDDKWKELADKAPLSKITLDLVVKHHPSPVESQKYRIPKIWPGEDEEVMAQLSSCDKDGPVAFMITKIHADPHAGDVALGRLYSGTLKSGMDLHLINAKQDFRVQQLALYMTNERVQIEEVPVGNIVAVSGLKTARSGETACLPSQIIEPFERIQETEPVVTEAIEAKSTKDLPKLVEVLYRIAKQDPAIHIEVDEETGECKMSGTGELHLEIWKYRIVNDHKIPINSSDPIVVYRETIDTVSPQLEGKSPNKHNRFYISVQPLEQEITDAIQKGELPQGRVKKKMQKELTKKFAALGMDAKVAKGVASIHGNNIFMSVVKGEVHLGEVMELCMDGFDDVIKKGPLSNERCAGLKVVLHDVKLHEDAIHRGPAQVIPAVRNAIKAAMLTSGIILTEPVQKVFVRVPETHMGAVNKEMQGRRGQILDIQQEGDQMEIVAKAPVAEMFGFAGAIRSATEGRVLWSTEGAGFEKLPPDLQAKTVSEIRARKGLSENPQTPSDLLG
jgi:elongation factor 2